MSDPEPVELSYSPPADEGPLLAVVEELGLVNKRARARLEKVRGRTALNYMLEREWLFPTQMRRLERRLESLTCTCYLCTKRTTVERKRFRGRYTCEHCNEDVSFAEETAGLGDALLPNPPERIIDKLIERLLLADELVTEGALEEARATRKTMLPRPALVDVITEMAELGAAVIGPIKKRARNLYRKRIAFWAELDEDHELARWLVVLGIVTQAAASKALLVQLQSAMNGDYAPLRLVLRRTEDLTKIQLEQFLPISFDNRRKRARLLEPYLALAEPDDGNAPVDLNDSMAEALDELVAESGAYQAFSFDFGADLKNISGEFRRPRTDELPRQE